MTETPTHNTLPAGYKLHWYEIKSVLGQGGFGITYLADDLNLERQVAIKEYFPIDFAHREETLQVVPISDEKKSQYEWGLERFVAEARTLSKFDHPNIVKVHAVFEENDTGYMVMSYESGHSLQESLDNNETLDEETLLGIVRPLLDGLSLVHEHEFIHRDIKPDNIFIRTDGTPALLDFGSARQSLSGESTAMTVLVTPGYAPVEQYYSDSDEQGPWTDIYGLGATMYRAITGKPLTNAVDRSKSQLNKSMEVYKEALDLEQPNYSRQFLQAVDHAIQFNPIERPQTVGEWRSELPEPGRQPGRRKGATEVLSSDDLPVGRDDSGNRGTSKSSAAKIALVALPLLMGVFVAGYVYLPSSADRPLDNSSVIESRPAVVEETVLQEIVGQEIAGEEILVDNSSQPEALVVEPEGLDVGAETQTAPQESSAAADEAAIEQQRQLEADKKAIEEARLRLVAEQDALAEQKRLAELEAAEQAEQKRLADLRERRIDDSRGDFTARSAVARDTLAYGEANNVDLSQQELKRITVPVLANIDDWQSSGVTISRGRSYSVKARGIWRMGPRCKPTDANGFGSYGILCLDVGGQIVANQPHSGLIAKIGKQSLAFYVGAEFSFSADNEGILYMRSNDASRYIRDNSQNLDVTITLNE